MDELTQTEVRCGNCDVMFAAPRLELDGIERFPVRFCHACIIADDAKKRRDQIARRHDEWLKVCPAEYRRCDPEKLPQDSSRKALNIALGWDMSPPKPGLGIAGPESGLGKTRIAHAAARAHFIRGSSFISIGAAEFGIECSSRWGSKLAEWLSPMCSVGILLIDDLGKERTATEHVASTMYQLIEARSRHQRPILFTTNHSVVEIQNTYGSRYGEYIVRRLRDYCRFINLYREKNAA